MPATQGSSWQQPLREALFHAFDVSSFRHLLVRNFPEARHYVSWDEPFNMQVFQVVHYFVLSGQVRELVEAARTENPGNVPLKEFWREFSDLILLEMPSRPTPSRYLDRDRVVLTQKISIPWWAYLRAMWNLYWSCVLHPLSETTIDLSTGRVLYRT